MLGITSKWGIKVVDVEVSVCSAGMLELLTNSPAICVLCISYIFSGVSDK